MTWVKVNMSVACQQRASALKLHNRFHLNSICTLLAKGGGGGGGEKVYIFIQVT